MFHRATHSGVGMADERSSGGAEWGGRGSVQVVQRDVGETVHPLTVLSRARARTHVHPSGRTHPESTSTQVRVHPFWFLVGFPPSPSANQGNAQAGQHNEGNGCAEGDKNTHAAQSRQSGHDDHLMLRLDVEAVEFDNLAFVVISDAEFVQGLWGEVGDGVGPHVGLQADLPVRLLGSASPVQQQVVCGVDGGVRPVPRHRDEVGGDSFVQDVNVFAVYS